MRTGLGTLGALAMLATTVAGCFGGNNGIGLGTGDSRPVGYIYSTLYAKNAVLEIDTVQARAASEPINVSNGPRSLVIDPRGRGEYLYVVCEVGATVDVVDRRNRRAIRNINVGRRPYGMAISPTGTRGFVTNQDDDTVTVVDMRTQQAIQTVQLSVASVNLPVTPGQPAPTAVKLQPRGIATNATGTKVFVACAGGFVAILSGDPGNPNAAPQGNGELTGPTQPSGTAYSAEVRQLVGSVSPLNVVCNSGSAEGDLVYVSDPAGNRIFYFNANQPASPQFQQLQGTPWGLAVGKNPTTGKADKLYVSLDSANAITTLDLPNLGQSGQAVNAEGRNPQNLVVSSLGDEIYVSLTGSNNVGVFKRVGANLARPEVFNLQQLNPTYIAPTGDLALGGFLGQ